MTSDSRRGRWSTTRAALIDSVDLSNARAAGLKLVLDYSFGTTSFVMPNLLAKLEAEVLVVNPYANTASVLDLRPPGQRGPGLRVGAAPRVRTWERCSTPVASTWPSSTTWDMPSPTTRPCWCC